VTKWDQSIEEYLKKISDSGGPTYQTEPIQGSYADEALRQGKRISDGTAGWAPYLDYNYAYFKKGDALLIFQHTQNPGRGCLAPLQSASDFLKKSNLNQDEYKTILNNYSSYSPENYLKFTK
jgi:hypothetical protein